MAAALTLYRSTIGKKAIMAITGLILVGFVVAHMFGNLKIYFGAESFNHYAEFLREVGDPLFPRETLLWIARIVLLGSVILHITAAVQLTRRSQASHNTRYAMQRTVQASYASRTMRWGGVIIVLFIIYHLLHFTAGAVGYSNGQFVEGQVYNNVVTGFRVWYVSLFYIAAMVALGFHLYHGVWSMFQSLGLMSTRTNGLFRVIAVAIAVVVVVGNISIPVAVMTGLVNV